MDDRDLLSAAIKASGKSVRGFARDVLTRDPRSVWRWLSGPQPTKAGAIQSNALPRAVREKCEAIVKSANEQTLP